MKKRGRPKKNPQLNELQKAQSSQDIDSYQPIELNSDTFKYQDNGANADIGDPDEENLGTRDFVNVESENSNLDFMEGFKIKKIKKAEKLDNKLDKSRETILSKKEKDLIKFVKVEELNVVKTLEGLLELSNSEDTMFHIMKLVQSSGNKSLVDKRQYIQKKWYHLKSSNLEEQEYRMKEKAQERDEIEEINEIQEDILNKLASSKIRGFETKEMLLENATQEFQEIDNIEEPPKGEAEEKIDQNFEKIELDEESWLDYKRNQLILLDKLLNSSYFVQSLDRLQIQGIDEKKQDEIKAILGKDFTGGDSDNSNSKDKKDLDFEHGEGYNRREKKAMNIKLSRYIGKLQESHESSKFVENYVKELDDDDICKIGDIDLKKLLEARTDKTYYNEKIIENSYNDIVGFLKGFFDQKSISIDSLSHEKLEKLVNSVSFSLNGLHYQKKFRKTSYIIHPYDLLFILSKIN